MSKEKRDPSTPLSALASHYFSIGYHAWRLSRAAASTQIARHVSVTNEKHCIDDAVRTAVAIGKLTSISIQPVREIQNYFERPDIEDAFKRGAIPGLIRVLGQFFRKADSINLAWWMAGLHCAEFDLSFLVPATHENKTPPKKIEEIRQHLCDTLLSAGMNTTDIRILVKASITSASIHDGIVKWFEENIPYGGSPPLACLHYAHEADRFPENELKMLSCPENGIRYLRVLYEHRFEPLTDAKVLRILGDNVTPGAIQKWRQSIEPNIRKLLMDEIGGNKVKAWKKP